MINTWQIIAAYDKVIRKNYSPEWDTIKLVGEDDSGEVWWEMFEVAEREGLIQGDLSIRDENDLTIRLQQYKLSLLEEVKSRTTSSTDSSDRYGRTWNVSADELCKVCGQPDNCGDCTHGRLSEQDVERIGGRFTS